MSAGLPHKRSVALVIRPAPRDDRLLLVQRPADDEDLPGAWGLPAASLGPDESWTDAVARAAKEKLGVDVQAGALLNEGRATRRAYVLHMRLYEATIQDGEPAVEQPDRGVTRYAAWTWGEPSGLIPAAEKGSLCSRLFLEIR